MARAGPWLRGVVRTGRSSMILASTRIDTWYWPRGFRDTMTCDRYPPVAHGRDQTVSHGLPCLVRVTLSLPLRVNAGYCARFAQKFTQAVYRSRGMACHGPLDGVANHAVCDSSFHPVSILSVSAWVARRRSVNHTRNRSANARSYTYRTQPNVQANCSTWSGVGWKRRRYARLTTGEPMIGRVTHRPVTIAFTRRPRPEDQSVCARFDGHRWTVT